MKEIRGVERLAYLSVNQIGYYKFVPSVSIAANRVLVLLVSAEDRTFIRRQ